MTAVLSFGPVPVILLFLSHMRVHIASLSADKCFVNFNMTGQLFERASL